jgi:hypothetical protein
MADLSGSIDVNPAVAPASSNRRGRGLPTDRAIPRGLVVDDEPEVLITAIKAYMQEHYSGIYVPDFDVLDRDSTLAELDLRLEHAHFVVLDHHFHKKICGFKDGLQLGKHILSRYNSMPIFYYTGFFDDWDRDDVAAFRQLRNVSSFKKEDLRDQDRLDEFCTHLLGVSARGAPRPAPAILALLGSAVLETTDELYRLVDFDGKLRCQKLLSLKSGEVVELPTDVLRDAGIRRGVRHVQIRISRYSQGQVLSDLSPHDLIDSDIAESVIKSIRDECEK